MRESGVRGNSVWSCRRTNVINRIWSGNMNRSLVRPREGVTSNVHSIAGSGNNTFIDLKAEAKE